MSKYDTHNDDDGAIRRFWEERWYTSDLDAGGFGAVHSHEHPLMRTSMWFLCSPDCSLRMSLLSMSMAYVFMSLLCLGGFA